MRQVRRVQTGAGVVDSVRDGTRPRSETMDNGDMGDHLRYWLVLASFAISACTGPAVQPESGMAGADAAAERSGGMDAGGNGYAPPENSVNDTRPVHEVVPGDTLFSIAWRHGVDMRYLVAWNGLADPDLIRVGQRLYLAGPANSATVRRDGREALQTQLGNSMDDAPWRWPVRGPVLSGFGAAEGVGGGIGIGGEQGTDILAAAPRQVMDAGGGLAAYGLLITVRHNSTFLSAYGHNEELLVAEGEAVEQGQPIARMGLGPDRKAQVHFEIRRNGTPVNPMQYLPR